MLECVVNISEGRDRTVIDQLSHVAGDALLDVHIDPDHHRSVFTLFGVDAVRALATEAAKVIDLGSHTGAHPRIGAIDVVPFVPLGEATAAEALTARDAYAAWSADALGVPCFVYGPERTLPDIRRGAFTTLKPDFGGPAPHRSAGATAVGQRGLLVAYNLWLTEPDLALAQQVAKAIRAPAVRALGLPVGGEVQVSMNLIAPHEIGPAHVFDAVAARADIARAELVGLVPQAVVEAIPRHRWPELDLAPERTIEARLESQGVRLP